MEIIKTTGFNQFFEKLPPEIQHLCNVQEKRFKENWRVPDCTSRKYEVSLSLYPFVLPVVIGYFFISRLQKLQSFLKLTTVKIPINNEAEALESSFASATKYQSSVTRIPGIGNPASRDAERISSSRSLPKQIRPSRASGGCIITNRFA